MEKKQIYSILNYEMLNGVSFKTHESLGEHTISKTSKNAYGQVFECESGERFESNRYVTYSLEKTSLDYNIKLLPYFADVTEDLPPSMKRHAETFAGCQLMTEKHGGYLQFWDSKNNEVRRIAMNSNTYKPVKHFILLQTS